MLLLDLKQIFDKNKLSQSIIAYKQNQRDAKALWALHYYCEYGWCQVPVDREKVLACLERAAQEGHAGASYKLAEYFSKLGNAESLIFTRHYTSDVHIAMCKDKTDDCNDEPYYDQQHYIVLLESFTNQTLQAPQTTVNTVRHRFRPQ